MSSIAAVDVRAWLVWGGSAFLIALMARNPLVLLELGMVVVIVRGACVPPDRLSGVGWLLRLAPVMLAIGVLFNLLTVRAGDQVLASLPSDWPVLGGNLTWNALAFGVVSALALFVLILIGTTLGALIRWTELARVLPQRVAPLAVAGSVAWVFLPELTRSFTDIRESMQVRGVAVRGPRTMVPLIVPLLAQGLERAMITAEALEVRGFGGAPVARTGRRAWVADVVLVGGMVLLAAGVYDLARGSTRAWPLMIGMGTIAVALGALRRPATSTPRTQYRVAHWDRRDTAVAVSAAAVAGVFVAQWTTGRVALGFDPYPTLAWPTVDFTMMLALPLLAVPAAIAAFASLPAR